MNKKINSAISILLGVSLIVLAAVLKSSIGAYFWIPLSIGSAITVFSVAELARLIRSAGTSDNRQRPDESEPTKIPPEYRRKSTIMTRPEADAFMLLRSLFGEKYEIFPQIPLVAVIDKITQNSYRNELFRVIDFVVVDKQTFSPLILIELNDSSHMRADRQERDRKVREICSRAGLPLVTFTPAEFTDANLVKATVKKNMLKR